MGEQLTQEFIMLLSLLLYMLETCHSKKLKANTVFRLLPFQSLIFFLLYKGTARRRLERICVKEQ